MWMESKTLGRYFNLDRYSQLKTTSQRHEIWIHGLNAQGEWEALESCCDFTKAKERLVEIYLDANRRENNG